MASCWICSTSDAARSDRDFFFGLLHQLAIAAQLELSGSKITLQDAPTFAERSSVATLFAQQLQVHQKVAKTAQELKAQR